MRRLMVGITVAAMMGGAAWAVGTATGSGRTPANCMDTLWRTHPVSTSSTKFAKVPGLGDTPIAIFPIAIDVNAVVSGAPVDFRILSTNVGGQTHASKPGFTRFVPARGGPDSFSFGWVERNRSAAVHGNFVRLQWRSSSGGAVHMLRGDMSVRYHTENGACTGSL
jgi:hypothetical protein